MKKINIQNLTLIITEKCNLDCAHCLRGQKSAKCMSNDVIEATLKQVAYINELTISGGEVLLALDRIEKIITYILENNVIVRYLSFVINGTIYSHDFLSLLNYYNKNTNYTRSVAFNISNDIYHKESINRLHLTQNYIHNIKKYQENKYFNEFQDLHVGLIREGNAINLDPSLTYPFIPSMPDVFYHQKTNFIYPGIAVNPDGIVTEPDSSFINQKTIYNYGNILEESIKSSVLKYGFKFNK